MGVMNCSRNGCENIMCDHHSSQFGYICWDCMDELKALVPDVSIEGFMNTPKRSDDLCKQMMKEAAIKFIEREFTVL